MGLALLTQHRQDAPALQFPPQGPRVIPPLSLQLQRPSARPALLALERRNGIHQRQGLRHIMGVGSRQPYGQRDALTVGDDVVLATGLGRSVGLGPVFCPQKLPAPRCCPTPHVSSRCAQRPAGVPGRPDGCTAKRLRPASPGVAANRSYRYRSSSPWAGFPRDARLQHEQDACQDLPVWYSGPSSLGFGGSGGSSSATSSQSSSETRGLAIGLSSTCKWFC
jgi:hypothetical protein